MGDSRIWRRPVDRRLLAVCLLCLVAVMAGCGVLFDDDAELPESDEIAETYESLDAYNATYVFTSSNGTGEQQRIEGEVIFRPGTDEGYQTVRSTTQPGEQRIVSNGTVVWTYNKTANEVVRSEPQREDNRRRQIRRLVNRINRDENDETGVPALPIVPLAPGAGVGNGQASGDGINVSTTASYEGTETVGDREAHVLTLESTGGSETRGRWTYYLDTEWYVLLRSTTNVTIDGEWTNTTFRLQNVTFNPEISEDRFEFTPPENATVINSSDRGLRRYESRERLAADANLQVPAPDVPEGFEFEGAQRFVGNLTESVTLEYASDVATVTVSRRNTTFEGPLGENEEPIEVGNRTGTYRQFPRQNQLRWQCAETTQFVTGPLARETLVDIAESVRC
jgi:outer membrane lipoprotein-sorting protein